MSKNIKSPCEVHLGKEVKLGNLTTSAQLKFLQGKVLTIIDASLPGGEQKKAVKDLLNNVFSNQLSYLFQLHFPDTRMMTQDEVESTVGDIAEIQEEAMRGGTLSSLSDPA